MKKIILFVLFLLVVNTCFGIRIYDDFNRPDNQNVSEGYEGGFVYYEKPVNYIDNLKIYNGDEEVLIKNNKLHIEEKDYCDFTTIPIEFDKFGNLSKYEEGSIKFNILSWSEGPSERWFAHFVFGNKLSQTPIYTRYCGGQGDVATWNTGYSENRSFVFFQLMGSEQNKIFLSGRCGEQYLNITNITLAKEYKFQFQFDVEKGTTKIKIGDKEKEFKCNLENVTEINSIVFQTYTNQGDVVPYLEIDNLEVNINNQPEEPETNPILYEYAPIFIHHPREIFFPKEINSMLLLSDLKRGLSGDLIKPGPLLVEDVENLSDRKLNIDLKNVNVLNDLDHPHPDDFDGFETKIYGRVTTIPNIYPGDEEDAAYTRLQYYVFYPYQNWYVSDHEGDWQYVEIILNDMDEIESVSYKFGFFKETYYDLDYIDLIDNHPIAYVAEGSHNMYGSDELYIPFSGIMSDEMKYLYRLFFNFKSLDKIDKTGQVFVPSIMNVSGEKYTIEQINDSTGWINYQGLWGQKHFMPYRSGQRGPKYSVFYETEWPTPQFFGYMPGYPFMMVHLSSPLDVILFNESRQEIYPDIYTGPDSEPEVSLTLEKGPYVVVLNATDEGQFNLSVFFYDGNKGINLKYDEIQNTATTWAELEVYEGSEFKLCLDYDQDGIFDVCYYPTSFITSNGYEYEIPDQDNDSVDDLRDNCVEISNPNQEDFNYNEKGDICDNPRYYKNIALNITTNLFSKKFIKFSLREKYWKNDFEIKNPSVFLKEIVAAKKSNKEVKELLAKADKLIIEYRLNQIDFESLNRIKKRRYRLAERYYQKGLSEQEKEHYISSIRYFFRAWINLHAF